MLKKICITVFVAILCGLGIYKSYLYIKEQHRPEITFVSKENRYYLDNDFEALDYVSTVTDYKQNTLEKKSCIRTKVIQSANNFKVLKYTVNDGNKNFRVKKIKIFKLTEGIDTVINIDIDSKVSKKDKPKSKNFIASEKDLNVKTLFLNADNYGATSLCSYKIKPIKNDMNIIIGYRCIIK